MCQFSFWHLFKLRPVVDNHTLLIELCDYQRGEKLSPKEVKMMIDEVDDNKDGRLDYNEVRYVFIDKF